LHNRERSEGVVREGVPTCDLTNMTFGSPTQKLFTTTIIIIFFFIIIIIIILNEAPYSTAKNSVSYSTYPAVFG